MSNDDEKKTPNWLSTILKFEDNWCNVLGIFNPYLDPFTHMKFSKKLPMYDLTAYHKYPKHNFVYDKLWVCKSQGLVCGMLSNLPNVQNIEYPIFIKPRYGHKTATSKDCYKINSFEEALPFINKKDMMWNEFIEESEGMTDFILLNGSIQYQMTLKYSDKQNGFIDEWKYISEKNKPPVKVADWLKTHLHDFTGVVNIQYRGDKIIEVGLRLARGGAYIKSTNSVELVENINLIINKGSWDYTKAEKIKYTPFYSFKCYSTIPILYLFPQHFIDRQMKAYGCKDFYEYYFEPSGKSGMVFFQFLNEDFNRGLACKTHLETLLFSTHLFLFLLLIYVIKLFSEKSKYKNYALIFFITFVMLRVINPLTTQYSLFKAQRQQYFG